jgi:hypothetical protein
MRLLWGSLALVTAGNHRRRPGGIGSTADIPWRCSPALRGKVALPLYFGLPPMKRSFAVLAATVALAAPWVQAQTMFKCVQDGKTVYQAQACPEAATQATLKAQAAPAAAGSSADVERLIEFMSTYRACADAVTMWRQEMAQPYEAWRKRNAAAVSRIENDRQLSARLAQRVEAKRNGKAGMCRPVGLELRGVKE